MNLFSQVGAGLATLLVLLAIELSGCDSQRIEQLEEGVATEADVRRLFGDPDAVYDERNGSQTYEYARQPEGQRNYMITIGSDGKMSALRQVLTPENFAKIVPGLDPIQVRRMLGRPAHVNAYALKREEAWDWRFVDGTQSKVFTVTFNADARVVSTASTDDVRVAK